MDALSVLQRLGSGRFLDEVLEALIATAEEVVATGKPGKVTVTFGLSTQEQGDPMVIIDETVGRTSPKKDPKGALFFAMGGELHKDDPRQAPLIFRTVDTTTGEMRDLNNDREERNVR